MRIAGLLVGLMMTAACHAQLPALAFLSREAMQQTRAALESHQAAPQTVQAWQQLKQAADRALKQPNPSVIQKGILPPSGSRHDYLSLSAYWWPDPEKADGLPWVRRDGEVNPASKNNQSDGVRLARFTADVQALTLAWYFSGEARYATKAQSMIRTWFIDPATRMNPNLNFAQGVPGRAQGRHTGVLDGRYFSTRVVDALRLLQDSPGWRQQDQVALQAWFSDYLDWLQNNTLAQGERDAPNNHGSWYAAQVAGITWYLHQPAVIKQMTALAQNKIDGQIRADGTQPLELARTRSFHYSYFNLQALTSVAQLAQRSGAGDLWHYQQQGGSLLSALDYMAPFSDDDKRWPWKNRDRISVRLIPLLSLADSSLNSGRYQRWIERATETQSAFNISAAEARGAEREALRDMWLLSRPATHQ
nr:alginate lyase family protein [Pantoea rodasii]